MLREAKDIYSYNTFDQDGHIAVFLQTSAVYLGVSADQAMALSYRSWQPIPLIHAREAQHA